MSTDFYDRLVEAQKRSGLTQKELLEQLNLGKNSFTVWKRGVKPRKATIEQLAKALHVKTNYLLGQDDSYMVLNHDYKNAEITPNLKPAISYEVGSRMRPIIRQRDIKGNTINNSLILDWMPVEEEFDNVYTIWVRAEDDSMSPDISIGDLVLIDRGALFTERDVVMFMINDAEVVIRMTWISDDVVTLHAKNPSFEDIRFEEEDRFRLRFVGQVRRIMKNYD